MKKGVSQVCKSLHIHLKDGLYYVAFVSSLYVCNNNTNYHFFIFSYYLLFIVKCWIVLTLQASKNDSNETI